MMPRSMLSPELKARWVAALRSGTYVQGHGQWHDSKGRFCSLGVYLVAVCELRPLPGGGFAASRHRRPGLSHLPLTQTDIDHLIRMNDNYGASFEVIADWVEKHL